MGAVIDMLLAIAVVSLSIAVFGIWLRQNKGGK
jgi:hypothetical protein